MIDNREDNVKILFHILKYVERNPEKNFPQLLSYLEVLVTKKIKNPAGVEETWLKFEENISSERILGYMKKAEELLKLL
jgi:hypothetical protein